MKQRFSSGRGASLLLFAATLLGGFLFLHIASASTYWNFLGEATTTVTASGTSAPNLIFDLGHPSASGSPAYFQYAAPAVGFCSNAYPLDSFLFQFTDSAYTSWTPASYYITGGTEETDLFSQASGTPDDPHQFSLDPPDWYQLVITCAFNDASTFYSLAAPGGSYSDFSGANYTPYAYLYSGTPDFCLGDTSADCPGPTPTSYYAQIENTPNGRFLLRSSPATSTDSNFLERLPQDWVVYVSSTADATTSGGYNWYDVVDPTDGVEGWMAASSSGGTVYLQYPTSTSQTDLEAVGNTGLSTSTGQTADEVFDAIDHYYNNASTTSSLYSSDDGNSDLSFFGSGATTTFDGDTYSIFPEQLFFGIAEEETGGTGFNNQYIHFDYGSGVMQLTPPGVWADEPTSTGNWINNGDMPSTADGSYLTMYPCTMAATDTYINCYANGGEAAATDENYIPYGDNSSNPTYMYYANSPQSIYANIKDGMRLLQDKYQNNVGSPITTATTTDGITYSGQEREIIIATAAYGPHHSDGSPICSYVGDVSNYASNLPEYFPDESTSTVFSTSSISDILQKMQDAATSTICAELHSPATLNIEDSSGHTVGIINGNGENSFPLAVYDPNGKWAEVLAAGTGNYTFKVTGAGTGTYGFDITIDRGNQRILFSTGKMPVVPGQIDTYTINPNAIMEGRAGITLQSDIEGDGTIDKTENFGAIVENIPSETTSAYRVSDLTHSIPINPPAILFAPPEQTPTITTVSSYPSAITTSTLIIGTTTDFISSSSNILSSNNQ